MQGCPSGLRGVTQDHLYSVLEGSNPSPCIKFFFNECDNKLENNKINLSIFINIHELLSKIERNGKWDWPTNQI